MPLLKDDYIKTEKINGIIYNISPSGSSKHGQINSNIHGYFFHQLKRSICAVYSENMDLYLSDDEYMIPDVMLICDRKQIKKNGYHGVPRFIAETLSPATALKDRSVKKEKYAEIGVDEYWIISPNERSLEVYYLEDGTYKLVASYILEDDETNEHYNADTVLTLKAMPTVSIQLQEIFENVE